MLGGGRYDLLIEQLGGKPCPSIGFAAGIERLMMILESDKYIFPEKEQIKIYIVTMGQETRSFALKLISDLRNSGIKCETDFLNRSVKSQMREANKQNAEYVIVLGEEEMRSNSGMLKRMSDGNKETVNLNDLINTFSKR